MPPEPHFRGKRVMVNGKPGDPEARVTAKPISRDAMIELAVHVLEPPQTEAERRQRDAASIAMFQHVAEFQTTAAARGVRAYLEAHPEALPELFRGDPAIAAQINQAALAGAMASGPQNAIEEDRLGDEIVSISQAARASTRGKKQRKRR